MKNETSTKVITLILYALLVLVVSVTLYFLGHARLFNERRACEENLKLMASVFRAYMQGNPDGFYPELDPTPGRLAPKWDAVYPKFLKNPYILVCPANKNAPTLPANPTAQDVALVTDDHSYWYFGYVLPNEEIFQRFVHAYRREATAGNAFLEDLNDGHGSLIMRLRDGVAGYFVSDVSGEASFSEKIPIVMERPDNHGGGGHVLYLDGHIEFIPYPGKYPMTPQVVRMLGSLDVLPPVRATPPVSTSPAVPIGILKAAATAKAGFIFRKLDLVMSVISDDFSNPEYVNKQGLRNHLNTMQKEGSLDGVEVYFQHATYTRNGNGTWSGFPFELRAHFGTAIFSATLRQEGDTWRVITLDLDVRRGSNLNF
jgi:prepilin-type processing-associated H-X9-DG protein